MSMVIKLSFSAKVGRKRHPSAGKRKYIAEMLIRKVWEGREGRDILAVMTVTARGNI